MRNPGDDASNATVRPEVSWLSRARSFAWSDPLGHFILGAVMLLAAQHWLARPEILISPELLNGLCREFETRARRAPTAVEIERLTNEYVEDEVLYREALRTGVTQDNRVRGVLIQTMRTSLRPVLEEPTDAELEAFRREMPNVFCSPERTSFTHISFAAEKDVPPNFMARLCVGEPHPGPGNLTKLPDPMPPTDRKQLEWMFGAEFTAALGGCRENEWSGPLASRRGVHFVRVLAREASLDLPLSEIRPRLAAMWIARKESEEISGRAGEMRKAYRIKLPSLPPESP